MTEILGWPVGYLINVGECDISLAPKRKTNAATRNSNIPGRILPPNIA